VDDKKDSFVLSQEVCMKNSIQVIELPERLLTAVEVANVLNISRAFAYQLMQRGKIRTVYIEGARRVRPEDLRLFIKSSVQPPSVVDENDHSLLP
jgi:excisionase family DNA binding protein